MPKAIKFTSEWTDEFGDFSDIRSWLMAELAKAYFEARKGKRRTRDEQKVELRLTENLIFLTDAILARKYKPGRGIAFTVKDPVKREIFAAPFADRIIHHFLFNGVNEWWERHFIDASYSCRKGKGTLYAAKDLLSKVQAITDNFSHPAYVVKLDVKGYFMSLPKDGLYERVVWGLDRQFPNRGPHYEIYKYLWREVIFDDPVLGVEKHGRPKDWAGLPDDKSLFKQPANRGIPIGNLSSQLLSNIYLDKLDRFIVFNLGYGKFYGRYVDDFFFLVRPEDLPRAKLHIKRVAAYLQSIGLTLHPKKIFVQEVRKGVPFVGYVVYPGYIVPGRRIKGNYLATLKKIEAGQEEPEAALSYMGIMKHINGNKIQAKIFDRAGLDFEVF